ncbi:MAG: hypothetical protein ACLR4Z_09880 [Butyricicoccaceae bacterium]
MNMFAHLKSKPEMLSANDLLEIFDLSQRHLRPAPRARLPLHPPWTPHHRAARRDDRLAREPSAGGAEQRREEQRV